MRDVDHQCTMLTIDARQSAITLPVRDMQCNNLAHGEGDFTVSTAILDDPHGGTLLRWRQDPCCG